MVVERERHMAIDIKDMNSRLWTEWVNGMKIMMESLLKDYGDIGRSACTFVIGNENFIQRAVMYIQRKSYIGKFKDYKARISAYEKSVMELVSEVNKMLVTRADKLGTPAPAKIEYRSTLDEIIIDGDDRFENEQWGDHAIAAFEKLSDYLGNIMDVLDKAQKEIGK